MGRPGCGENIFISGVKTLIADVLQHRFTEEQGLLKDDSELPRQVVSGHGADINFVDPNGPFFYIIKPGKEMDEDRDSSPSMSHKHLPFSGSGVNGDILQLWDTGHVREGNVVECYLS